MRVLDLDTPALVVDLDRVEGNLARMAHRAAAAGLALRPHTKTHKTPQLARRQAEHGAAGLTVAKLGEAEVMVGAGFRDIFIANQIVGAQKVARLVALTRQAEISVGVDSLEVAEPLSAAFAQEGRRLAVLIEVDVGLGRCGVAPEAAEELAARVHALSGLTLAGFFCYPGQVYGARDAKEMEAIAAEEGRVMGELAERVAAFAGPGLRVSGGSSPTARHYRPGGGLTEIRPGTYVFNDRMQVARGAAEPEDCALTVLATVVSTPGPGRAILDAGSKALGTDPVPGWPGQGMLKEDNRAVVARVNEEHGFLDLSAASRSLRVGDKVEVIPNHCCFVTNLFDEMAAVRAGEVVEMWPVLARGRMQ